MRDTPNGTWPARIVPHCISTLSTPCHCERIDMSHRLIHARPETTHGTGRVEILHISKENMSPKQTRRSEAIWGKMLRMRRTLFSDRVHICAKWRRHRLSTTETRRDLVKLFQQARACRLFQASIADPVCPRIHDRNTLRDSSLGWVPQLLVTSLSRRHHSRHYHRHYRCATLSLPTAPLPLPLPAHPGSSLPRPSSTQPPSPRVTLPCPPPSAFVPRPRQPPCAPPSAFAPRPRQPPCAGPRIRAWAL